MEIVSVKKIWDAGQHNAFTDLIFWKDKFWCTFREAEDHVGGDGKIRVLVSKDAEKWESTALLAEDGIDLRDPKLSITTDGRLMIVAGGSVYGGTKVLKGRQPRVTFSKDGRRWTETRRVLGEGDWLWRVTWFQGRAYGVSYNHLALNGEDWRLKLVESDDGLNWRLITALPVPGRPNETTLRFLSNGDGVALVRREGSGADREAWIGMSKPPYREWSWKPSGFQFGGPNFIVLSDGKWIAGGRDYRDAPKSYKTAIGPMTANGYRPELEFPSGGDTSYPGLVWRDGILWMSYYSSHEGKTSVYLAKIRLP